MKRSEQNGKSKKAVSFKPACFVVWGQDRGLGVCSPSIGRVMSQMYLTNVNKDAVLAK